MERCPLCNLQYKRNNKYSHEVTNTNCVAKKPILCEQCKIIINLADKRSHLQPIEH